MSFSILDAEQAGLMNRASFSRVISSLRLLTMVLLSITLVNFSSASLGVSINRRISCWYRTVGHYSLYLWCKDHDQRHMIHQIEQLYTENLTATAYRARLVSILAGLHNFSNSTQHIRFMLILRALSFSADPTTQTRSARMLKAYLATPNDKLTALRYHVIMHG